MECEQFNVKRQGMCKALLDERGECPEQGDHGDEFTDLEQCSSCGSKAPHHLRYVRDHGLCVS